MCYSSFSLQFVCTVIAILLHFFYLCTFSWLFLEGLHIYRMISEVRDINYGPMRFYYLIGWGVPAFITGLKPHDVTEQYLHGFMIIELRYNTSQFHFVLFT